MKCYNNILINCFFLTAHKRMRKVYVSILSYHEGKDDITNAAQTFCTNVKNKEVQSKIMNIEYLSQLLDGNDTAKHLHFVVRSNHQ